jgi:hypothetical protein
MYEQGFLIGYIAGAGMGLFVSAFILLWTFGGKKIRQQIKDEW